MAKQQTHNYEYISSLRKISVAMPNEIYDTGETILPGIVGKTFLAKNIHIRDLEYADWSGERGQIKLCFTGLHETKYNGALCYYVVLMFWFDSPQVMEPLESRMRKCARMCGWNLSDPDLEDVIRDNLNLKEGTTARTYMTNFLLTQEHVAFHHFQEEMLSIHRQREILLQVLDVRNMAEGSPLMDLKLVTTWQEQLMRSGDYMVDYHNKLFRTKVMNEEIQEEVAAKSSLFSRIVAEDARKGEEEVIVDMNEPDEDDGASTQSW